MANDCARAHHRHSAIQLPLSDGGAPNCMENVMASDTSLYFEGLHGLLVTNWLHSIDTCTVHTERLHAEAYVIAVTSFVSRINRQI